MTEQETIAAGKGTLERLVRRVKSPSALSCFARHIPAGICFDCGRTFAGPFARVKIRFHSCKPNATRHVSARSDDNVDVIVR